MWNERKHNYIFAAIVKTATGKIHKSSTRTETNELINAQLRDRFGTDIPLNIQTL